MPEERELLTWTFSVLNWYMLPPITLRQRRRAGLRERKCIGSRSPEGIIIANLSSSGICASSMSSPLASTSYKHRTNALFADWHLSHNVPSELLSG